MFFFLLAFLAPLPAHSTVQRPPLSIRRQPTGSTTRTVSSPGGKTVSTVMSSPPTTPASSVRHTSSPADAEHLSELPGSYPVAELQ